MPDPNDDADIYEALDLAEPVDRFMERNTRRFLSGRDVDHEFDEIDEVDA